MRHSRSRAVRLTALFILTASACPSTCADDPTEPGPDARQNIQQACKAAGDASTDFANFQQAYPGNLTDARGWLVNLQLSLNEAVPFARADEGVLNAVENAQRAADAAQTALDAKQPVDTRTLGTALDDIGNACSTALGA